MKICQISEGIVVGKIKNVIEQAILDGVIPNDYDASYDYLIENKDKWLSEFKSQINTKTETTQ